MMKELKAKQRAKKKIIIESIFVLFIAIAPFLYKIYDFLPEEPDATISFLGFTIDDGGFGDVSMYVWFITSKVIPLYLMIIWFMTAKNWWYHIILIPIAMYAFQLFEVLFDSDDTVESDNIWWLIPILMIIIPIVYFIRIKLYDKYVHGIDLEAMEAELKSLKKKQEEKENRKVHKAVDAEKQIEIKTMDTSQI
ncbi:hypothetical protein [Maribacter polysaccharolyticus]|uniref:hypothetical protein n=1 Tax=Maribacter polysaccharolyticus TaxID=3020831 RepID=UPI00237F94C2|nr:hypothetical protein [Maribacter polysaccharolyticus]MDE3740374.1 hypothetical protein [Maribacter polysaccharolyticus]